MANNSQATSGGIGFTTLLGLIFIVLKLTKTIDWSWWWVLSPFWIGAAFVLVILIIIGLVIIFSQR